MTWIMTGRSTRVVHIDFAGTDLTDKETVSSSLRRKLSMMANKYEVKIEIEDTYKNGLSIDEISVQLGVSVSTVYTYLPYQTILYNLDAKSVNAYRQKRYRERNKEGDKATYALESLFNRHRFPVFFNHFIHSKEL